MATSTAPGLAVALVHYGRAAWAAGYGVGRSGDEAAGDCMGVLRLVEQGRIG
jgi:hypothetical protein